ncbi:hypothetical protein HYW54_00660 [Candidatus Gottesmanbacteria bacterium]|nr:hypothetical protein [Candidatus Gottesmanbacteria bacterium]
MKVPIKSAHPARLKRVFFKYFSLSSWAWLEINFMRKIIAKGLPIIIHKNPINAKIINIRLNPANTIDPNVGVISFLFNYNIITFC